MRPVDVAPPEIATASFPNGPWTMTEPLAEQAHRQEPSVLLVEDEPLVRLDMAEALREAGYRVIECATAQEADDVLKTGQRIDALVTDVRTPGPIDGLALASRARRRDPALPIVLVPGHLDPREADAADLFLRKPVTSDEICAGLERIVRRGGSRS